MSAVKDILLRYCAKDIKNGRGTRFWLDKWCSATTLGSLFQPFYSQADDPAGPIFAHYSDNRWNICEEKMKLKFSNSLSLLEIAKRGT